jgi:2,4-dienoyl-CoA reductase-like NADH-dependent reductase (Old Yellow Enzyme family)/thioredoxin reductase
MSVCQKLFEPISIGTMELKNRVVMAPMATHFAGPNGEATQHLIDYYTERARGGVALIIVESNYVQRKGRGGVNRFGLYDDSLLEGHTRLVEAVHTHGAKICAQLHHAGRAAHMAVIGEMPISPTATVAAREMTLDDIREVQRDFARAAGRAKKAGFDAVHIHGAHGYLIQQFLSPAINKRQDDYGGSEEARMRFLLEVVEAVRDEVGEDFPILARLSAEEFIAGGYGLDFILKVCASLEEAGVCCIDLSSSFSDAPDIPGALPGMDHPACPLVHYAEAAKDVVGIPVGTVGRIYKPRLAEQVLRDNRADLILLGRSLLADAHWVNKAREGRQDEIRHCIACNRCLDELIVERAAVKCTVNPELGREEEMRLTPATAKKKVLVVGGGPAGMEAARVAARRGHEVTLCEQKEKLGGMVLLGCVDSHTQTVLDVARHLEGELQRAGVTVETNRKITAHDVESLSPDVLVLATGAESDIPDIPGIDGSNVCTTLDLLSGAVEPGDDVVIIGGGLVGGEVAEFLAEKGKRPVMVKKSSQITGKPGYYFTHMLTWRLNRKGVRIITGADVLGIEADAVRISRFGQEEKLRADTVVVAKGMKPNRDLLNELHKGNMQLYIIGDCDQPRRIQEAISSGAEAGLKM